MHTGQGMLLEAFKPTGDMSLRSCWEDSELVQKPAGPLSQAALRDKGGVWGGLPKPVSSPRVAVRIRDGQYKRVTLKALNNIITVMYCRVDCTKTLGWGTEANKVHANCPLNTNPNDMSQK